MRIAAVALVLLAPLLAGYCSRRAMLGCLARRWPERGELAALALPGTCRDLLWALPPLGLACLLAHLGHFRPGAAFFACAALLAALGAAANIIDLQVYLNTRQRFFSLIIPELRPANLRAAASPRQKRQLLGLAAFLLVFPPLCLVLFASAPDSQAASLAALIVWGVVGLAALAGAFPHKLLPAGLRPEPPAPERYIDSYGIGNHEDIRGRVRERILAVRASALGNLLGVLRQWLAGRSAKIEAAPYSGPELEFLRESGLIDGPCYAGTAVIPAGGPGQPGAEGNVGCPFRRIILICMESLGQRMLGRYNPGVSREVTPFLHSLLDNYPRLDRLMTANMPTHQGLYALHASRLHYEEDAGRSLGGAENLVTLLREQGFHSIALSGVTRHYGDKDSFFPRLLGYDEFLAQEDLRALYPDAPLCGWGLADSALFQAAVPLLARRREGRALLQITTADTHPGYYHTLPEDIFPEYVRASGSRLFRALFEADLNLMFFFRALGKAGLYDDSTLIIITGDHSPNHGNEYMRLTGIQSFEPDLTPLVFVTRNPAANPFQALDPQTPCSQLDVLPTLIDGLGLRRIEAAGRDIGAGAEKNLRADLRGGIQGRSLFIPGARPVLSRYGNELRLRWPGGEARTHLDGGRSRPLRQVAAEKNDSCREIRESALRKWYFNQSAR